jgi:hypothetical protein
LAMSARLLKRGEFPGYVPGRRESVKTPEGYVVDTNMTLPQRNAWVARLKGEGFRQDLTEFLTSREGSQSGLSGVMQLGFGCISPSRARRRASVLRAAPRADVPGEDDSRRGRLRLQRLR